MVTKTLTKIVCAAATGYGLCARGADWNGTLTWDLEKEEIAAYATSGCCVRGSGNFFTNIFANAAGGTLTAADVAAHRQLVKKITFTAKNNYTDDTRGWYNPGTAFPGTDLAPGAVIEIGQNMRWAPSTTYQNNQGSLKNDDSNRVWSVFCNRPDISIHVKPGGAYVLNNMYDCHGWVHAGDGKIVLTGGLILDDRDGSRGTSTSAAILGSNFAYAKVTTRGTDRFSFMDMRPRLEGVRLSGRLVVEAHETPSVIRGPYFLTPAVRSSESAVVDVRQGATLRVEAPYVDFRGNITDFGVNTSAPSNLRKTGKGRLVFTELVDISGTLTVDEGEIVFDNCETTGKARFVIAKGARVILADGTVLYGTRETRTQPDVIASAEIHLDAMAESDGYNSTYPTRFLKNIGTIGGAFSNMASKAFSPVTANVFGPGKPAYTLYGGNASGWFMRLSNTSSDLTVFTVLKQASKDVWSTPYFFINQKMCSDGNVTGASGTTYTKAMNLTTVWGDASSDQASGYKEKYLSFAGTSTKLDINKVHDWKEPRIEVAAVTPASATKFLCSYEVVYTNSSVSKTAEQTPTQMGPLNHDSVVLGKRWSNLVDGSWSFKNAWNGYMGEFIVFFKALTDAERAEVTNYLRAKWLDAPEPAATLGEVELNVPEDAEAAAILAGTRKAVKTGAGTLVSEAPGAVAQEGLRVAAGRVAFETPERAQKAEVWFDVTDASARTEDEAGHVTAVANKGRAGGSFDMFVKNGNATVYPVLGTSYTEDARLPMLEFDNNVTTVVYDNHTFRMPENPNGRDPISIYAVLCQPVTNKSVEIDWNCAVTLTPAWDGVSAMAEPENRLRVSSTSANYRQLLAPYSAGINTGGNLVTYMSNSVVKTEAGMSEVTLTMYEFYTNRQFAVAARASDNGTHHFNVTNFRQPVRDFGMVRIGSRVVANGNTSEIWTGGIGEILVFTRALSVEEKTAVVTYLDRKWLQRLDNVDVPAVIAGDNATARGPNAAADVAFAAGTTLEYRGAAVTAGAVDMADGVTVELSDAGIAAMPDNGEPVSFFTFSSFTGTLPAIDALQMKKWGLRRKSNADLFELYRRGGFMLSIR